jgi:tRNA(Arg) A34 adenosine deaminase TadA
MNKILKYFKIAGEVATIKNDNRHFWLGAIAIRSDGVMVKSNNGPTPMPNRQVHAEYRVLNKCGFGATIYVARIRQDTKSYGMARPCANCLKAMRSKGVKRIYYTIDENEYGVIIL